MSVIRAFVALSDWRQELTLGSPRYSFALGTIGNLELERENSEIRRT